MADRSWLLATDIGVRIRELREVMGWSQEELGGLLGRLYQQISNWENGKQRPPRGALERLADARGWPVEIFAEGGPMPSAVLKGNRGTGLQSGDGPVTGAEQIGGTQLPDEEILQLLAHDRPGFVRYLLATHDQNPRVPAAARLQFLDFAEETLREHGQPIPEQLLEHLRGLIREGAL